MKKLIGSCLVALAGMANAAGIYDGIYSNTAVANDYVSVHTNGNAVIVTEYTAVSASGVGFPSPIGLVPLTAVPVWQLLSGTINGNVMSLGGQLNWNSCQVTLTASFNGTGLGSILHAAFNSSYQTALGASAAIPCGNLFNIYPNGLNYVRIF